MTLFGRHRRRNGLALLLAVIMLGLLGLAATVSVTTLTRTRATSRAQLVRVQARWLAQAAVEQAVCDLLQGKSAPASAPASRPALASVLGIRGATVGCTISRDGPTALVNCEARLSAPAVRHAVVASLRITSDGVRITGWREP